MLKTCRLNKKDGKKISRIIDSRNQRFFQTHFSFFYVTLGGVRYIKCTDPSLSMEQVVKVLEKYFGDEFDIQPVNG